VIGVNRLGQANALAQAGATVVVDDLSLVAVSADAQEGGDTSNE
jgi:hypothetical protein